MSCWCANFLKFDLVRLSIPTHFLVVVINQNMFILDFISFFDENLLSLRGGFDILKARISCEENVSKTTSFFRSKAVTT